MKLELGMYVRTKYNGIFNIQVLEAIRDINCDYIEINYIRFPRNEILKASHNIIDLIEEGDYVNGTEVKAIFPKTSKNKCMKLKGEKDLCYVGDIRTIVTKEQFSQMEYKIDIWKEVE